MATAPAPASVLPPPTARASSRARACLAFCAATMFFTVAAAITAFAWAAAYVRTRSAEERARFTRRFNLGFMPFAAFLRDSGLIAYRPCQLPAAYAGRPVLVVANHPSLIDVVLLLSSMPTLVTVVKESWYRSWVLGPVLRETDHLPGPGHAGDERAAEVAPVVGRIAAALARGTPVLAFPEGTRSRPDGGLRRLRRGAVEAAVRAGVDVLPLFIGVDAPFLTKGQPLWRVPPERARFVFEWLAPISTRDGDAKAITRRVAGAFRARLEAHPR